MLLRSIGISERTLGECVAVLQSVRERVRILESAAPEDEGGYERTLGECISIPETVQERVDAAPQDDAGLDGLEPTKATTADLQRECEKVVIELEVAKRIVSSLEAEKTALQAGAQDLRSGSVRQAEMLHILLENLQETTHQRDALQQQLTVSAAELESVQHDANESRREHNRIAADMEDALGLVHRCISTTALSIPTTAATPPEGAGLEGPYMHLRQELLQSNISLQSVARRAAKAEARAEKLRERLRTSEDKLKELEMTMACVQAECDGAQAELRVTKGSVTSLEAVKAALGAEIATLCETDARQSKALSELSQQLRASHGQSDETRGEAVWDPRHR